MDSFSEAVALLAGTTGHCCLIQHRAGDVTITGVGSICTLHNRGMIANGLVCSPVHVAAEVKSATAQEVK